MKDYKQDVSITSLDASIDTHNALMWVLQKPHHPSLKMFLVLPMKIIDELIFK
jgi:hypothetical protein